MNNLGTIKLETERLILRRFERSDSKDMFNNWASNPNVTKFMTWPTHLSEEVSIMVINSWIDQYMNNDFYQWAIELKENNQVIGSISIVKIDNEKQDFEVGYCLGEKYWNKGITSEAVEKVINFLFNEVGALIVSARHDIDNVASGKVMIKNKMKLDKVLNQSEKNGLGKICDVAYYSISKDGYK